MKPATPSGARVFQWLLIVAALALLVFLIHSREPTEIARPPQSFPLLKGEAARVIQIERFAAAGHLRLERSDGRWRLSEPLEDLADNRMVRELLRAFQQLEIRRILDTDSLGLYGLEKPRHRMILHTYEGRCAEFSIGDITPAAGEIYAHWSGLVGVALLPRYLEARFFDSDLLFWREREMLPQARASIDSVCVIWPAERARMRRLGQEEWVFLEPRDREADGLSCERAVAAFWRFPFDGFFDSPAAWPALGLEPPRASWIVFRGGEVDTLRIGARLGMGKMAVQLAGRVPGEVRDDLFDFLTGGVGRLEVRRLLRGHSYDQRVLALTGKQNGRCYVRRAGRWLTRRLETEERLEAQAGILPDTSAGTWLAANDASLSGDLANLFEMQADAWLPPLTAPAMAGSFSLRLHLWNLDGACQWAFFQPCGERAPRATPGASAVGSRFPTRPMSIPSALIRRWRVRLERP